MAWIGTLVTPIFKNNDPTIPVGLIGYLQIGVYGAPIGLLLGLTTTSKFLKVIQTDRGFREITF